MNYYNSKLPSPADLAKKDETTPVSLRVKESTAEMFKQLAEKNGAKPASMMTSLLDMYADQYREIESEKHSSLAQLKHHIMKISERIGNMDDEAILVRISRGKDGGYNGCYCSPKNDYCIPDILERIEKGEYGGDLWTSTPTIDPLDFCVFAGEPYKIEKHDYEYSTMNIPSKTYTIVVGMVWEYSKKAEELFNGGGYLFTDGVMQEILNEAIKEQDRKQLAEKLAKILVKCAEDFYE